MIAIVIVVLIALAGCRATPDSPSADDAPLPSTFATTSLAGLVPPTHSSTFDATIAPPLGWEADTIKRSKSHVHQAWKSPTGHTAYGIIRFQLPLPVGHEMALIGFLQNMRKSEGEATLIEKRRDPETGAIDFVADGGLYRVRTILSVRGAGGWAVYAGTLRDRQVHENELELALRARQHTRVRTD